MFATDVFVNQRTLSRRADGYGELLPYVVRLSLDLAVALRPFRIFHFSQLVGHSGFSDL